MSSGFSTAGGSDGTKQANPTSSGMAEPTVIATVDQWTLVPMAQAHLSSRLLPWDLQPLVGFGVALARQRFHSTGPITNLLLRDRVEEDRGVRGGSGPARKTLRVPS
jgi:hypothetical protein